MILAILQARASSRRLPGKVLKPILGQPMLARQIERLLRCRRIDKLVLATSMEASDEPVAEVAQMTGIDCFRGSLDDVLDRFYQAALPHRPRHIVRLTGDCPLADWEVIDGCIGFTLDGGYDWASNALKPTWPDGLDVECMTFAALETAWREAKEPLYREHVTPFLHRQSERFKLGSFEAAEDLSGLRWTVDEPADFEFASRIFEALYPANAAFTTADILGYLARHPEVVAINARIERNEGYTQALAKLKSRG